MVAQIEGEVDDNTPVSEWHKRVTYDLSQIHFHITHIHSFGTYLQSMQKIKVNTFISVAVLHTTCPYIYQYPRLFRYQHHHHIITPLQIVLIFPARISKTDRPPTH